MACKRTLSQTFLLSLVMMAGLPVILLGYFWATDQYHQFEIQSGNWRSTYLDMHEYQLRREVRGAIDRLELQRAQLESGQRSQLQQEVANGAAQLDSLRRRGGSRSRLLRSAHDLLAPIRFGGNSDHYFIATPTGTALLMPSNPGWEGDAAAPLPAPLRQLLQSRKDGFVELPLDKPGRAGGVHPAVIYARYYAPLDIYLGAVSYTDDVVSDTQRALLARFANRNGNDVWLSIVDRNGNFLFDSTAGEQAGVSLDKLTDADGQPLGPRVRAALAQPDGGLVHFTWQRPDGGRPVPAIAFVRTYPGWHWGVGAGFLLDKLDAAIAAQRAEMQQRVRQRIGYLLLLVLGLVLTAALVAQRLALNTRRSLERFATFFDAASKHSSHIDIEQLPYAEFEALAANANRMNEQRHRTENALRVSEKRFEMALRASASHLWDLDLHDRVVTVGGSLFQQLGYSAETRHLSAGQWADWLHPDDVAGVHAALQRMTATPDFALELRLRTEQGEYRWFNCRGGVVENDSFGRPLRALGIATDIGARKRMEQELIAARIAADDANHAKNQFLSNISHELRTPLNGVLGYAQILLRDGALAEQQRHNLLAIESCGQHLLALINDILDLARIESGHIDLNPRPCDLLELLQSVSALVRERAEAKGLTYTLDTDAAVPAYIVADAVKLRQILVNLLGNAVKFTTHGGVTLRTTLQHDGGELLFQICDTGVGIAPQHQRDIFQPFHQLAGDAGGTGLGLAISQRLCEAMGGLLSVRSTPGAGSCFSFNLPARRCEALPDTPVLRAPRTGIDTAAPVRVLVADDNPVNRKVLAGMLKAAGLEMVEAENGEEALRKLRGEPMPLVLMDVRMPVMDGFAATRAIKSDPRLRDTVVIAVSASVSADVEARMRAQGCDDFIGKPVQMRDLLAKLAEYLPLPPRTPETLPVRQRHGAIGALPKSLLDTLQAALVLGDVAAMRSALEPLHSMAPEFVELAADIERLLDNFDIDAVRDLLAPRAA